MINMVFCPYLKKKLYVTQGELATHLSILIVVREKSLALILKNEALLITSCPLFVCLLVDPQSHCCCVLHHPRTSLAMFHQAPYIKKFRIPHQFRCKLFASIPFVGQKADFCSVRTNAPHITRHFLVLQLISVETKRSKLHLLER